MFTSPKILTIKSDKSELKKVEAFLSDIFKEYNLSRKNFNNIFLCISEAVVNSIEHGNNSDCRKMVTIKISCKGNQLHIEIFDEGEGFDFRNIDDPTKGDNIKKESGRGIHIIRSLSDSLEYNKKGNSVQLKIDCK